MGKENHMDLPSENKKADIEVGLYQNHSINNAAS